MRRDLASEAVKAGMHGCVLLSGDLADPYPAATGHFAPGGASAVDIDRVVALADAWQKGATPWPAAIG